MVTPLEAVWDWLLASPLGRLGPRPTSFRRTTQSGTSPL